MREAEDPRQDGSISESAAKILAWREHRGRLTVLVPDDLKDLTSGQIRDRAESGNQAAKTFVDFFEKAAREHVDAGMARLPKLTRRERAEEIGWQVVEIEDQITDRVLAARRNASAAEAAAAERDRQATEALARMACLATEERAARLAGEQQAARRHSEAVRWAKVAACAATIGVVTSAILGTIAIIVSH